MAYHLLYDLVITQKYKLSHKLNSLLWNCRIIRNRIWEFGLYELANVYMPMPFCPALHAAVGNYPVVHLQHYTPFIKGMDNDVAPLLERPHLMTYLLGEGYISKRPKFKSVGWGAHATDNAWGIGTCVPCGTLLGQIGDRRHRQGYVLSLLIWSPVIGSKSH